MSAPKRKALGPRAGGADPGRARAGRARPRRAPAAPRARATACGRSPSRRFTPRPVSRGRSFDEARLDELAASIRTQGIIQPLIVRARRRRGGGYELIAGERRWRAAQRAGLHEVPAVVRDVAPTQAFEMALVENLQREDLNPLEEAAGYQRLVEEFGYTQEQLSERVGKDRSTVANALRLLRLPESVRDAGRRGAALDGSRARAAGPRGGGRDGEAGAPDRRRRAVGAPGRGAGAARAQRRASRRPRPRRRAAAPVDQRARSGDAPVARARHARRGRRGGPGARPDRHPLPLARSARRAARKAAAPA